jgi:membrane protease YdiL (CAAX protease family)
VNRAAPDRPAREAVLAFAGATAGAAALYQVGRAVPFIGDNLQAFIAAIFIYVPVWLLRRRDRDIADYGFTVRPLARSLALALATMAVLFPLFLAGFVLFYQTVCASDALGVLAPPGFCPRFRGWSALAAPRPPAELLTSAIAQIVVVALPEELFFRGFLLGRLEEATPPRRRLLGGGLGRALLLSALLFALGHVLVDGNPRRLAVFFPGLVFGWLRSATGSILAGTIVHAASNLYIEALQRTFFA